MAIDDPLESLRQQVTLESSNPTASLALAVAVQLIPFGGIVHAIQSHYSARAAMERVHMLLNCLEEKVRQQGLTLDSLRTTIDDSGFVKALLDSVEGSIRSTDRRYIERLAAVLGGTLCHSLPNWDEAAALINDLIRLTEKDIKALCIMCNVFYGIPTGMQQVAVSGYFTSKLPALVKAYRAAGFGWDEFYSHAARLAGFGLAIEVHINHSKMIEEDVHYCFRQTGRGEVLARLLGEID
jgi:hypothetical protein